MVNLTAQLPPGTSPTILAIGAHSDDIEIGCGGALMTLMDRYQSPRIEWVVLSAGGTRAEEAAASAERFVGSPHRVVIESFRERFFPYLPELKEYFGRLAAETDPHIVFAPWVGDMHQDHRTTGELTRVAFRDHLLLHYEIPKYDGDVGRPNVYIPLTAEVSAKKVDGLLAGFPSQHGRDWFDEDVFRGLMRLRGVECRAPEAYAEAFHCNKLVIT